MYKPAYRLAFHLVVFFSGLGLSASAIAQRAAVPPRIVSNAPGANSVGFVTTSGLTAINAEIGRWDTPYPYPDTGDYAPGLQPTGFSSLEIDIDVNDGGLVAFRYAMQTYDAGIYDWYDIILQTPTGNITIVNKLGKPGSNYGSFWQSPSIAISQSLDKWKNQRVKFIFRVMQDGWGDQTQGLVRNFVITNCDIGSLTPLTTASALSFEAGNSIDTTSLTAQTNSGLGCLRQAVTGAGGSFRVTSAYRPPEYQNHLREIWDTWKEIRNRTNIECEELKRVIQAEFQRHELLLSQRPAAGNDNAPHSRGIAFDASVGLPSGQNVDALAQSCGMYRPWPGNDPVHFQPR